MTKAKTKFYLVALVVLLALSMLFGTFAVIGKTKVVNAYGTASGKTVGANAVSVSELWNGTDFNKTNLKTFMGYISPFVASNSPLVTSGTPVTAEGIRTHMLAEGYTNTADSSKGKDIVVKLGGFDWSVTYLSKTKTGDIIATLWLTDPERLSGKIYYNIYGNATTFSSGGYAYWSSAWVNDAVGPYASNMYGTSYIRSQVLNNGGEYATNPNTLTEGKTQHSDSVFAPFTMPASEGGSDLYNYIVTPNDVSWQEAQSAKTDIGSDYNCSNDAWGVVSDDGFRNAWENYSKLDGNIYNSAWKNDKLWLPSFTEVGRENLVGLWALTTAQRSFGAGVGTNSYVWTRSGARGETDNVFEICEKGDQSGYYGYLTGTSRVRPALHLNLTGAMDELILKSEQNGIKYEYGLDEVTRVVGYTNEIHANIAIPASITIENVEYEVTEIKSGAFNGANLESVTFTSETPITMGSNVFGANSGVAIYVPTEYVGTYQSAWSAYSGQIEELPETGVALNLSILLVTLVLGGALIAVAFKRKEQL